MKKKITRPKPVKSKKEMTPCDYRKKGLVPPKAVVAKYLDQMENCEISDWANDCRKRKWKKSDDYAKRKALAESFAKKNKD